MNLRAGIFTVLILLLAQADAQAQRPAFPGAEGFGGAASASGFSDATVYHVTNLNDSGPGSLRAAFVENSANKIVVFDVGGTITLQSPLNIKNLSNYYIAGQTAPSPVTVYGNTTQVTHSSGKQTRDVILRYLTFRKGSGEGEDAATFAGSGLGTNIIFDHVSTSWSEDELVSVTNNNTNVTVQHSIIAEALDDAGHAYGSLMRAQIDSNVTFHHNLYANNRSRQPRIGSYNGAKLTLDFRNNVVYNWSDRAGYAGGSSEPEREFADMNFVGNYLIAGPATRNNATRGFIIDRNVDLRAYQSGNFIDSDLMRDEYTEPNGADTGWGMFYREPNKNGALTQMAAPFATPTVTTEEARRAYLNVVSYVGNSWQNRDAIDTRIVNNVHSNTGGVVTAPNPAELDALLTAPITTRPAGYDSDNDGMSNAWELKHGLNPNSTAGSADWKLDYDSDGYTNLEEFLNDIGSFPVPAHIRFTGETNTRFAQITNWRTSDGVTLGSHWQPSRYDTAVVSSGVAVVDAVGQSALDVVVMALHGSSATLNVTSGWLETSRVVVGSQGDGTINHTGGEVSSFFVSLESGGVYNLSGSGVLRARQLGHHTNTGRFNFTGGVLSADTVGTDLLNQGGTLSPGDGVGATHVKGDLTLSSGVLEIEIGGRSDGQYDSVVVDGLTTLGGMLKVELADLGGGPYVPQLGDTFGILSAPGGLSGDFDTFDLPELAPGLAWGMFPGSAMAFLSVVSATGNPADFNADGSVDGADLGAWRGGFGSTAQPNKSTGDADADGDVDGGDFLAWQKALGAGVSAAAAGVPEPSAGMLTGILLALAVARRRLG